jgi:hypothetical protein
MAGVAANLTAMLDERYRRQGYEHMADRNEVTLAEAGLSPFPLEGTTDKEGRVRLGPIASGPAFLSPRAR